VTHRVLIYAHRGARCEAAENTRPAFDRALRYPIDGIETDVQLSRDGIAVLWHDRFLGKLGLPDKHIDDFDYTRLREMDFAAHFAPDGAAAKVVTLDEFIADYRTRCRLLIEIKNREWEPVSRHETKMRQALRFCGENRERTLLVSSFDLASLVYAHRLEPEFPLIYNLEPEQTQQDAQRALSEQSFLAGLCLPIETLDAAMVGLLRDRGKTVAVYTCNSEEEINKALALRVDILITDLPQKALALRG